MTESERHAAFEIWWSKNSAQINHTLVATDWKSMETIEDACRAAMYEGIAAETRQRTRVRETKR